MTVSFQSKTLVVDGRAFEMPWPVREAVEVIDRVFVLFDPDAYLLDPDYKRQRRLGGPAVRNLVAIDKQGARLWEAEFPEASDYYYPISSASPLTVNSFSSFRCVINADTGLIASRAFVK